MLVVPVREAHRACRAVRLGRPRDGTHGRLGRARAEDELRWMKRCGGGCEGGRRGRGGAGEPAGERGAPPGADALPQEKADVRVVDAARQRRLDLLAAGEQERSSSVSCRARTAREEERDAPRQRRGVVALLAQGPRDEEAVPQRVQVGAAALPQDRVAVAAALARREVQRLVDVAEEVDEKPERLPAAGEGEKAGQRGRDEEGGGRRRRKERNS